MTLPAAVSETGLRTQRSDVEFSSIDEVGVRRRRPVIAKVRRLNSAETVAVAPDTEVAKYRKRLKEVLATESSLFVDACIQSLIRVAKLPGDHLACTTSLSSSLEIIASLAPQNEAQASLAVHVACLHLASLNVLGRMHGVTDRNVVAMATAAAKLERAYQSGIEAFYRLQRGATQIVRVEHIEVQAGGQAMIGIQR